MRPPSYHSHRLILKPENWQDRPHLQMQVRSAGVGWRSIRHPQLAASFIRECHLLGPEPTSGGCGVAPAFRGRPWDTAVHESATRLRRWQNDQVHPYATSLARRRPYSASVIDPDFFS